MEIINKHYTSNDVGYYESPFNANNWGTGNHLVEYSKYIIGIDTAKFQHYTFNHAGQINLYGKLNNNKERTKLAQYLNAKYRLLMYGVDT